VAGVLAAFMLFLGMRGLIAPFAAAKGFGLPVANGDAPWLEIKAARDLCAGLTLATFLAFRNTRLMAAMLFANVLIPVTDMVVSLSAPLHDTTYAVAVHGGAAALMVVLAIALMAGAGTRREAAADEASTSPKVLRGALRAR
jgi:hypothetical protein